MSNGRYILDAQNNAVACDDLTVWGKFMENMAERIVEQEHVGVYWISTVFLGLDHNWSSGAPILWETMIFDQGTEKNRPYRDEFCDRYSSYAEAVDGHAKAVVQAKEWVAQDEKPEHPAFTRAKALSEPLRAHFPKSVEEAQAWTPIVTWRALSSRVLVVAKTRVECAWAAYCDAVPGINHANEVEEVTKHGAKLEEKFARALFPGMKEVPYAE